MQDHEKVALSPDAKLDTEGESTDFDHVVADQACGGDEPELTMLRSQIEEFRLKLEKSELKRVRLFICNILKFYGEHGK